MEGLTVDASELSRENSRLELTAGVLSRSESPPKIRSLVFRCDQMRIKADRIRCDRGTVTTKPDILGGRQLNLGIQVSGVLDNSLVTANSNYSKNKPHAIHQPTGGFSWKIDFSLKGANLARIESTAFLLPKVMMNGELNFDGWLSGRNGTIDAGRFDLSGIGIDLDTENGEIASESLGFSSEFRGARSDSGLWAIESRLRLNSGAIYVNPLYVETGKNPLIAQASLNWDTVARRLHLKPVALEQKDVFRIAGWAELSLGKKIGVTDAVGTLQSDRLGSFFATYIKPYFVATAADGISPDGQLRARVVFEEERLSNLRVNFSEIQLADFESRFALSNGAAQFNWTRSGNPMPSTINWDSASLYSIPLGRTAMQIALHQNRIDLLGAARFPILGGSVALRSFAVSNPKGKEPSIQLEASVDDISLDRLSEEFGWPPLAGKISGVIPGVMFQAGRLAFDGALRIEVFGGSIDISDLVVTGFIAGFPTLTADARIKDIDLALLTQRFSFGHMEGKIEGQVDRLYLENWKPVSFNAWFGTPASDRSRHIISQKAVENLSSLGSGSVTDVFSRGFLRFFDAFSYHRIGLGCRLQNGICDLRGVSPAESGYYIVKGGGIPRIDVIGYNQRVDWDVLLRRLKRVTQTEH